MLPKQIVCILNFFDICGYCTESSALAQHKRIQLLLFIAQVLLACVFTWNQFQLTLDFYEYLGPLQTGNEMLQYSTALCTHWLIIFDSFVYRREHRRFWTILQRFDRRVCKPCISFRKYLFKFYEYFLVSIALYALSFYFRGIPRIYGAFIYAGLMIICQFRVFYYIFCLDIVNWQLQTIDNELIKEIQSLHNRNERYDLKCFKWFNKHYGCVVEMTELLNEVFGWSQFALILFAFYGLLTDLNWCYAAFGSVPYTAYFSKRVIKSVFIFRFRLISKIRHSVTVAWVIHGQLIPFYLFHGTYKCTLTVRIDSIDRINYTQIVLSDPKLIR